MKSLLLTLLLTSSPALAKVVPTGINVNQIADVTKKFSGLLSLHSSNSPFALGEDFEIEITAVHQDLELNSINDIGAISSKNLLEPIATIRKGLYWNIDMGFTFALPAESHLISGYSFNLSHSSQIGAFHIKPELYTSNYNLDDTLNINSSGLSLIAFKKISFFHLGLGGRVEFAKGNYEEKSLGSNTLTSGDTSKADITSTAGVAKAVFQSSRTRLTLTYSFSDIDKSESSLSLAFKL
ncbi:MAG: hypothetical protein ACRBBP_02655 [Bdellovibrionales bacterium]